MGSAKKNLKATKKFEKTHLKGVLEKRKATAKVKQRQQLKEKQRTKRVRDADFEKGPKASAEDGAKAKTDRQVNDMSVDDFFQGGFEILEGKPKRGKAAGKLGKRKRDEPEEDSDANANGQLAGENSDAEISDNAEANLGMSHQTMKDLAEKDPEFYNFLKENDPETLEFDEDMDLAEIDDLSSDDGEDGVSEDKKPAKKAKKSKQAEKGGKGGKAEHDENKKRDDAARNSNELTREMVAKWKQSMIEQKSLRTTRQVVLAFRSAAHLNEVSEDPERAPRYEISSADVYNDILLLALTEIPNVIAHHLPSKESSSGKVVVQTGTKKSKALPMLLKSYTASIMHLLGTLSDTKTVNMTISGLLPILHHLLSFRKLIKAVTRSVVKFWCQPASAESTRVTAFLVLRRLMVIGDRGVRETVLKTAYQGLIQGCRMTNPNTISGINLMKNSAAELWGFDDTVGYTTGFSFIRQLAIHLRNSIVHNKNDAFRSIYNWQYVHSLDFWSCVLAESCSTAKALETGKESQLKLLIYPLVQITLGALRLVPAATYFPLRFQLMRSVLRISRATGTYIPIASDLLEVLGSAEMKKPPKASTLKPLDFSMAYKAPKSYLRTRVYQDGVGDQVVELLGEYLVLWATNIAFPEFSLPVVIQLKRWLKTARRRSTGNRNQRLASTLAVLVQKVETSAKAVEDRRAGVDFSPRDRSQVEAFMRDVPWEKTPLGAYVVAQRKANQEKARVLDEARREEDKKRRDDERKVREEEASDEETNDDDEDEDEDDDKLQ